MIDIIITIKHLPLKMVNLIYFGHRLVIIIFLHRERVTPHGVQTGFGHAKNNLFNAKR
jgi:hypothetical protein